MNRCGSARDVTPPVGADFVAPHHTRVPGLVDDVVAFASGLDVPARPASNLPWGGEEHNPGRYGEAREPHRT